MIPKIKPINRNLFTVLNFLKNHFKGDLRIKAQESKSATQAFTKLLIHVLKYLPEK